MPKPVDIGPSPAVHHEHAAASPPPKGLPARDADVAMALFDSPEQIHEPIDPAEERKLVRKVGGQ
jgi:hypothetical protein